jgi:CubicO group peptidase (beta-lactamase class C family)
MNERDGQQSWQRTIAAVDEAVEHAIAGGLTPGAVVLVMHRGDVVLHKAYGYAVLYRDGQFNPVDAPIPMTPDTLFDLASITKLLTATAAMQLWDQGAFNLDDPVSIFLPEFARGDADHSPKARVTVRQLLNHTSGFEPSIPIHQLDGSPASRRSAALRHPLQSAPGTQYVYSDLNMIALGALVETLSGQALHEYIREHITEPLGMRYTVFNPPAALRERIAATEYQPWTGRNLVWGEVHDENAWSLGGVAGHAGAFGTAGDLARLAQAMLNKGVLDGVRILSEEAVNQMTRNQLPERLGATRGLGWELNQPRYMGSPETGLSTQPGEAPSFGHTGFTGTSIVINPVRQVVCILLTNRVHPTRYTSVDELRRAVAKAVCLRFRQ